MGFTLTVMIQHMRSLPVDWHFRAPDENDLIGERRRTGTGHGNPSTPKRGVGIVLESELSQGGEPPPRSWEDAVSHATVDIHALRDRSGGHNVVMFRRVAGKKTN